jgi:predicted nucleotide-binding protein (sugar kinase/HSP70/actin superfamily)
MHAEFTKKMRKTHTIYMPEMLGYHNELLMAAFSYGGYNLKVIPKNDGANMEVLKYISNDYCLPTVSILNQILAFLESAKCDADKIAIMEPQAGGACRAGNIYNLIIEVLEKAGYGQIPVISLNMTGEEKHSGFQINPRMLFGAVAAVCYGDLLMKLTQQITPYEKNKGQAEHLRREWIKKLARDISKGKNISRKSRKKVYGTIINDFKKIPKLAKKPRKVGITGEIYIKYSSVGNFNLEAFLKDKGIDYMMGGFINYAAYVIFTAYDNERLGMKNTLLGRVKLRLYKAVLNYICSIQKDLNNALKANDMLHDMDFLSLKKLAGEIISGSYNIGDGWLMAAEIIDYINNGYDRILIVHPFGCLVSHVGARGVIKKLKEKYPNAAIYSVEYDYDQSQTLRESRLMLAIH